MRSKWSMSSITRECDMSATNCFSVGMKSGLVEGITLTLPPPDSHDVIRLQCGERYIRRDASYNGCIYNDRDGQVFVASLKKVMRAGTYPIFFLVKQDHSGDLLLFVDCSMQSPPNVTIRPEIAELQLRSGISGTADIVLSNACQSLVNFTKDGQELFVRYPTGKVERIVREDNRLWPVVLTPAEMAKVWLNCAEEALARLPEGKDAIRRREGIIFGVIKLLRLAKDQEVRGMVVDFLYDKQEEGTLSTSMKSMIRGLLERWNDLRRYTFDPDSNVVGINSPRPKTGAPKKRKQKMEARAMNDRIANGHAIDDKKAGKKKSSKKG